MEINAKQVKELREKTGAGMMDCKNALVEGKGDSPRQASAVTDDHGVRVAAVPLESGGAVALAGRF